MRRFLIAALVVLAGGFTAHAAESGRMFRLEPKPGSAWTLECTTSTGWAVAILGQKVDTVVHERLSARMVVERIEADGAAVLVLQVERLQAIQRTDDKDPVEYDSADPVRPEMDDETWTQFERRGASIVGRRWRLTVQPDGRIGEASPVTDQADPEPNKVSMLISSPEVMWMVHSGGDAVRLPDHRVAVGGTWLHQPTEKPAKTGEPAKPVASGGWFGSGKTRPEPVFESRYAGRERSGERTVDVVTTRHLPPRRTAWNFKQDPPVECDGRLAFDATTGDLVEGAWEGGFRGQKTMWWMLGTTIVMDMRVALRVAPAAPAAVARQAEAVRPLPPVTR